MPFKIITALFAISILKLQTVTVTTIMLSYPILSRMIGHFIIVCGNSRPTAVNCWTVGLIMLITIKYLVLLSIWSVSVQVLKKILRKIKNQKEHWGEEEEAREDREDLLIPTHHVPHGAVEVPVDILYTV